MKGVIRLGDPTDHGGQVVSVGDSNYVVDGIPVARLGDVCSCPKKGHNGCTIVSANASFQVSGVAVAFEGDKTSCGATLRSTFGSFSG